MVRVAGSPRHTVTRSRKTTRGTYAHRETLRRLGGHRFINLKVNYSRSIPFGTRRLAPSPLDFELNRTIRDGSHWLVSDIDGIGTNIVDPTNGLPLALAHVFIRFGLGDPTRGVLLGGPFVRVAGYLGRGFKKDLPVVPSNQAAKKHAPTDGVVVPDHLIIATNRDGQLLRQSQREGLKGTRFGRRGHSSLENRQYPAENSKKRKNIPLPRHDD